MKSPLPQAGFQELLRWIVFQRKLFRVDGNSMSPGLKPGDLVLADLKAYRNCSPQEGEIVVAFHPTRQNFKMIKRVRAIYPGGKVDLAGDNPLETTDFFGLVSENILGKVTSRLM